MKKILYTFLLICPLLFVASCEKKVEGCTNSQATNYNSNADTDDGSCEYSINGSWDIVDLTANGISYFNPLLEGYVTNGAMTFNDNGSCVIFMETSTGFQDAAYGSWTLLGANQFVFINSSNGNEEYYTIIELNATNCVLTLPDEDIGTLTLFLSR